MIETRKSHLWGAILVLFAAAIGVYGNALHGPFFFDDVMAIAESPHIKSLWPLSHSMDAVDGSGASGRPLVALSLALNYAIGGLDVFGYHVFNVLAHALSTLALFGFVRRALLRSAHGLPSTGLAFTCALLWTVHPLNTDAVNLVITRNEVMASGFVLASLYAADRGMQDKRGRLWCALAFLAACAAMLSKEIAAALPLLVFTYDRTFVSGSFKSAWKKHRTLHLVVASSWVFLAIAVLSGDRGQSVGFAQELTSLDYLRTQTSGILHYLRLSFWPSPLAVDYAGWPQIRSWGPALLPGTAVLLLLAGSIVAFLRGSRAGWVALAFFAILAPSSSFIPLAGEWLAEHRMYLPLSAVVSLAVLGSYQLLLRASLARRSTLTASAVFVLASLLAWNTVQRNRDYASDIRIWEDCIAKYPNNGRAHDHLGAIYLTRRECARALPYALEALRLDPTLYTVEFNVASILLQLGRAEEALPYFERSEKHVGNDVRFHATYAVALSQTGDAAQAILHLQKAVAMSPEYATAQRNLGLLYLDNAQPLKGLEHLRKSLMLEQDTATVMRVIRVLATDPNPRVRNGKKALQMARQLIQSGPPDPRWYELLGLAHAELGQKKESALALRKALEGARALDQQNLVRSLETLLGDQP